MNGTTIIILAKPNIAVSRIIDMTLTGWTGLNHMQFQPDLINIKIMGHFNITDGEKYNTAFDSHNHTSLDNT